MSTPTQHVHVAKKTIIYYYTPITLTNIKHKQCDWKCRIMYSLYLFSWWKCNWIYNCVTVFLIFNIWALFGYDVLFLNGIYLKITCHKNDSKANHSLLELLSEEGENFAKSLIGKSYTLKIQTFQWCYNKHKRNTFFWGKILLIEFTLFLKVVL